MSAGISERRSVWSGLGIAVLLAAAVSILKLVWVWWLSPMSLAEDEAFYWEWSQRLDWSYATKGPGIAWAIWGATSLFGTSEGAIRTVAVISGFVMMVSGAGLARDVVVGLEKWTCRQKDQRASVLLPDAQHATVWTVVLMATMPIFFASSLIATIDGPYLACWAVAAWAGFRAIVFGERWSFVACGAAIGLGFLFKYTILLIVPGLVLGAVWGGWTELKGRKRWVVAAAGVMILGLVPVVIWNAQHDWQTVKHLLGHLGLRGGDVPKDSQARQAWSPFWSLELIGAQVGFVGTAVGACVCALVWGHRARIRGEEVARRVLMLVCVALPIYVMYFVVSLFVEPEANWPVAGHVTIAVAAGVWLGTWGVGAGAGNRDAKVKGGMLRLAVVGGVISCSLMLLIVPIGRGLVQVAPSPESWLARLIPLHRFSGGENQALDVARRVEAIRQATGREPMIICQHYGRASRIRFYLPGRPKVYAATSQTGGRVVQQDYWEDVDLRDPRLLGRDALVIGGPKGGVWWRQAFERVEEQPMLSNDKAYDFAPVYAAYGFKGFSKISPAQQNRPFVVGDGAINGSGNK